MGGGPDVDPAFRWMITRAGIRPGTGGRFLIIRATGTDAYNLYVFFSDPASGKSEIIADEWVGGASMGLSSVETLVIPNAEAANDPAVQKIVARANAVFIAGGDQSDYIRFWKGTRLEQTLDESMHRNVPIGGTSAGLAVMGQFDYSALFDSVTSAEAMADPYDINITLDPNPLSLEGGFIAPPELGGLILDSHFDTRDRMGRMIAFVSRTIARDKNGFGCAGGILRVGGTGRAAPGAIGISVETALLVAGDKTGGGVTGRRITNAFNASSESAVYFVRPLVAPAVCASGQLLTIRSVDIRKLADSHAVFNLSKWTGLPVHRYLDVDHGSLSPQSWR